MRLRSKNRMYWASLILLLASQIGWTQPERLMYFPDTGRIYAQLDPGDELLQRNILITNQSAYNVSFDLSFDKEKWNGFAAGARYTSLYSLQGKNRCYIRLRTRLSNGSVTTVHYELLRGKCYSVYWNREQRRWDAMENACRRY